MSRAWVVFCPSTRMSQVNECPVSALCISVILLRAWGRDTAGTPRGKVQVGQAVGKEEKNYTEPDRKSLKPTQKLNPAQWTCHSRKQTPGGCSWRNQGMGSSPPALTIHCVTVRKGAEGPGVEQAESSGLLSLFAVRAGGMGEVGEE